MNIEYLNQSVLHRGINITCKSPLSYKYRIKKSFSLPFGSTEFMTDFVDELNKKIRKQTRRMQTIDIIGLIFEFSLVIILLVFSSLKGENETLLVILATVIILSTLFFIYLKISGVQLLNQRIQEFLDSKKSVLFQVGFRGLLVKAKWNDKPPEIFLNLLPESLLLRKDRSFREDSQNLLQLENSPED